MKYKNRQAFTITELVIVIAVIAILAAVMIPTFISLVEKANLSSDIQAVRQMNMALAVGSVEKVPEDYGAASNILRDAGYAVDEGLYPVSTNLRFLWHKEHNTVSLTKIIDTEDEKTVELIFPEPEEYKHLKFGNYQAYFDALQAEMVYDLSVPYRTSVTVSLDKAEITLDKSSQASATQSLVATLDPADATGVELHWISDDVNVATVNDGVVTAVGNGSAKITVQAKNTKGELLSEAFCNVKVITSATDVILKIPSFVAKSTEMNPEDLVALQPAGTTEYITDISWTFPEERLRRNINNGKIKAISNGDDAVKITATTNMGRTLSAECNVTVFTVEELSGLPETIGTPIEGVTCTVRPKSADYTVNWTCDPSDSVSFTPDANEKNKVTITPLTEGTVTIKANVTLTKDGCEPLTVPKEKVITVLFTPEDKLIKALSTESSYKLTESVDLSSYGDVWFEKQFTLDLGGNTLTLGDVDAVGINIKSSKGVTIKNGTIVTNATSNINVMKDGWLILEKVTVKKENGEACALVNKGTCSITGCTFVNESDYGDFIYNGVDRDGKPIGKGIMTITYTDFDGEYNSGTAIIWSKSQSLTMLYDNKTGEAATVQFIGTRPSGIPILLCEDDSNALGKIADKDGNIIYPS